MRDQQAEPGPDNGEHRTLGEKLSDEPRPPGAERHAHRELVIPREGTREKNPGDVRAGDQQHERRRAHEDQQTWPGVARNGRANRHHAGGDATERLRELMLQRQHRQIDVHLRGRHGYARLQSGEDPDGPDLSAVRVSKERCEIPRRQKLRGFIGRHAKVRRHHADDFEAPVGEFDRPSHDARVCAEPPAPESIEKHCHAARGSRHLVRAKGAPDRGAHPQHVERIGRDS